MGSEPPTQTSELRVMLTGGGTGGHVTPNIALIAELVKAKCRVSYLGSRHGIENDLLSNINVPLFRIHTGKLRRYFSVRTAFESLAALIGFIEAFFILGKTRPQVVFSKGGYVSLPVTMAACVHRIPIVIHESDVTLGLANRIAAKLARVICLSHEETKSQIANKTKTIVTGIPLRQQLFLGDETLGLDMCGFTRDRPTVLILGGSTGSQRLNAVVKESLPLLLSRFQVAHIVGKNQIGDEVQGYRQFEFVAEIEHLYACADVIVSRAGATTIAELLALGIPHILVPLSARVSRSDQIENARMCERLGFSRVIDDDMLNAEELAEAIGDLFENSAPFKAKMHCNNHRSTSKTASVLASIVLESASVR